MANTDTPRTGALVAVVTPVYNGAKHLEEAIRSVQAQSYRPLVHCILDNASTDATAEIIARYAEAEIPVVTGRNAETISFQRNFNAVLGLMPPEAEYFRMLHADDTMPPGAIAAMMNTVRLADGVVMVAGEETLNGEPRPHFFPRECAVFDASNVLARLLVDEAHVPTAHVLYRRDAIREGEEFYSTDFVECCIEAVFRVLSRGGRVGFAHQHVAETRRYAGSGSLIQTFAPTVKANIWEKLLFIERYGPAALSNAEYARVHRRYRGVFYRRLLWWAATGRAAMALRDLKRLRERGLAPHLLDFMEAVAIWPAYLFAKRVSRPHAPRAWPADAVRPAS